MRLITTLFCCHLALAFTRATTDEQGLFTIKQHQRGPVGAGDERGQHRQGDARFSKRGHLLKQPFTDEISSKFLDRYLDALDNLHLYFIQSDLKEFETYRHALDQLTLKDGNTTPGRVIFIRFLERLQQQYDYVNELLKTEKFKFDTDDNSRSIAAHSPSQRPRRSEEALARTAPLRISPGKAEQEKPEEIVKIITRRYTRILRALKEYDNDDVLEIYLTPGPRLRSALDYMGKSSLDNFSINMKLSLYGIGAVLRSEDGYCKIQSLVPAPGRIKQEAQAE